MNKTVEQSLSDYPNFEFKGLHTAYRKFDPVRGMDYKLLLNFYDKKHRTTVLKSYEVMKPLGLIEIVPSPYVTESTRVAILLPTFEHQAQDALNFIKSYEKACMENQDNTFLMLVLMYREKSSSKGNDDVFLAVKNLALSLTEKYKNDGSRIAWVSIRLPVEFSADFDENDVLLSSMYGRNEILSFAATDLALRKIGLESLVMICSNSAAFRPDFLNRVRMNTIQGFQVFSPIGFTLYPCRWTKMCKECDSCDVAQSSGYFDRHNYDVISFYSHDYVDARKRMEDILPIVRSDKDIINLVYDSERKSGQLANIMDMFVKSGMEIHVLRGIEPNLKFGHGLKNFLMRRYPSANDDFNLDCKVDDKQKCLRLASKKQFGDALVQQELKDNVAE
jgi:chondroitin polymerizing factor